MRALLALVLAGCGAGAIATGSNLDRVAYPNGKSRFEFELHDGIPNGRGRAWHENGKLASEGTYEDGARQGRFWFYDESGGFVAQAIYVNNTEVWRSTSEQVQPPAQWTKGMVLAERGAPRDATFVEVGPAARFEAGKTAPRPYFSLVDRTTAPARAGAQVGIGDAQDLGFGAATRVDLFGHYRVGDYGVFAQLSETRLGLQNDMTLGGRRTAILAGTYHLESGPMVLSTTGGLIASLGNADASGSVASYAGAEQRPSDAAMAIPAPLGIRSAASLTTTYEPLVLQIDAGVDWLLAGDQESFDALGRTNIGVGLGSRTAMLTAEFTNSIRLTGAHTQLHALALGASFSFPVLWISGSLVFADSGSTSILTSVGHDL